MSPHALDGVIWSALMVFAWLVSPESFVVFLFTLAVLAIVLVARAWLAHRELQRRYEDACYARNVALKEVARLTETIEAMEAGFCLPFPAPKKRA